MLMARWSSEQVLKVQLGQQARICVNAPARAGGNLLAVTGGTGYQTAHIQLLFQLRAQFILRPNLLRVSRVFVLVCRPSHIGDLVSGPQMILWSTVTIKTPLHQKGALLIHSLHLINPTMTTSTPNTLGKVDAVVEIGKVGKTMQSLPLN